jgi:predicted nuclease of predicted toxin-antitoxin system
MTTPSLLIDSNLPRRLARQIADIFAGAEHIAFAGMLQGDDYVVWDYARSANRCLITTGGDFFELAATQALDSAVDPDSEVEQDRLLKVIWLRGCEYAAADAEAILRRESARIFSFLESPELTLLILDRA